MSNNKSIDLAVLLTWVTCCVVYFSVVRTFVQPAALNVGRTSQLTVLAVVVATSWTGMLLVMVRLVRSGRDAIDPGAWMLFSLGIVLTSELLVGTLPDDFPLEPGALLISTRCLAYSLPPLSRRLAFRWKLVFFALLIAEVPLSITLPPHVWLPPAAWLLAAAATAITAAIVRDHRQGIRYSGIHWAGIVCWMLRAALVIK